MPLSPTVEAIVEDSGICLKKIIKLLLRTSTFALLSHLTRLGNNFKNNFFFVIF